MSDVALYRKYRPQTFKQVIGQDHVISVLEGAIAKKNIAHAYLFSGTRGTGKTSIARIFAKAIGTTSNDLYEIDAASNRGIDDVRELREAVNTLPFESTYKVYIIDEVHMLTKEAFNALLKTLEEPPAHAVFILATTELEKLPDTVVSRCQTFTFKTPNADILKKVIIDVAKKEGFTLEPACADLIALLGDGSFRDTLGILQKVIGSSHDKKISLAEVEKVTGAPKTSLVHDFVVALDEVLVEKGLSVLRQAKESGIDMKVFLSLVTTCVRQVLLYKYAAGLRADLRADMSESTADFIKTRAEKATSHLSSKTILALLEAQEFIGTTQAPELPLELVLVKLAEGQGK